MEGFQAGLYSGENVARKVEPDWDKVSHSNYEDHIIINLCRFTLRERRVVAGRGGRCGGRQPGRAGRWTGSGSGWAAPHSIPVGCSGRSVLLII